MSTIYDSGWVPVASGSISAIIPTVNYETIHVVVAASGVSGSGATTMLGIAGADTLIPAFPRLTAASAMNYVLSPKVSQSLAVVAPAANAANHYFLSTTHTGSLVPYIPETVVIRTVAGAGSFARIIVEGR
jgi:hypothetical protein